MRRAGAHAVLLAVLAGLVLALASSFVPGRAHASYAEIMGCEHGCDVAAAGWPLPYLIDYPGVSVVGSAGLTGALTGEDHFRLIPLLLTWAFWTLLVLAVRRLRRGFRED